MLFKVHKKKAESSWRGACGCKTLLVGTVLFAVRCCCRHLLLMLRKAFKIMIVDYTRVGVKKLRSLEYRLGGWTLVVTVMIVIGGWLPFVVIVAAIFVVEALLLLSLLLVLFHVIDPCTEKGSVAISPISRACDYSAPFNQNTMRTTAWPSSSKKYARSSFLLVVHFTKRVFWSFSHLQGRERDWLGSVQF